MSTPTGLFRKTPLLDTYYFADLAADILKDPHRSGAEWSDFIADLAEESYSENYSKYTTMHRFLREMISRSLYDRDFATVTDERTPAYIVFKNCIPFESERMKLGVELALRAYGVDYVEFEGWGTGGPIDMDAFFHWYQELQLSQAYEDMLRLLTDEVFTVVFTDKRTLFSLNYWLAQKHEWAGRAATARRRPPSWARRAVFFRDRGRCARCGTDLSGLLSLEGNPVFDHVVPLIATGPNDVTNLQLLCSRSNGLKGTSLEVPVQSYELWFEPDD